MTTTRPGHEPTTRSTVIVDVAIDVNDLPRMKTFWEATLGYSQVRAGDSYSYLLDPTGRGPHLFLQLVPERRTEKNRLHLDVVVPSLKDAVESAESRGAVVLREVTTPMLLSAAAALAHCVSDDQLNATYIVPSVFDPAVATAVAAAVRDAAPGGT